MNHDGLVDIIFAQCNLNQLQLLINSETSPGTFTEEILLEVESPFWSLSVTNVNSDEQNDTVQYLGLSASTGIKCTIFGLERWHGNRLCNI